MYFHTVIIILGLNQLIRKLDKRLSNKKDKRNSFTSKPRVEGTNSTTPPPKNAPKFAVKQDVWTQLSEQNSNSPTSSQSPHANSDHISMTSTPLTHLSQHTLSPCNPAMYSFSNSNHSEYVSQDSPVSCDDFDSPVSSPLALLD